MSFQEHMWKFLNSDLGLLVSGFFLTTLAGSFLTYWYKRESKKHEVRFVKLHEDRAKAIRTFHDKTIELKKALDILRYFWRPIGSDPAETSSEEINKKVDEFLALSEEYKIFFRKELCDLIDSISENYLAVYLILDSLIMRARAPTNDAFQYPELEADTTRSINNIFDTLDDLIESLRQEFRNILGVE